MEFMAHDFIWYSWHVIGLPGENIDIFSEELGESIPFIGIQIAAEQNILFCFLRTNNHGDLIEVLEDLFFWPFSGPTIYGTTIF